ncbi:unnamed protein product, partial [Coccothraustes coccothraustes]
TPGGTRRGDTDVTSCHSCPQQALGVAGETRGEVTPMSPRVPDVPNRLWGSMGGTRGGDTDVTSCPWCPQQALGVHGGDTGGDTDVTSCHSCPRRLWGCTATPGGDTRRTGVTVTAPLGAAGRAGGALRGLRAGAAAGDAGSAPRGGEGWRPPPEPAQSTQELTNHGSGRAQALLLSAGGAVHRLADGLALGSAFAASGSAGAAAGAGLALHELPRAFSDALVLWQSGLGPRRTVALAAAAALPVVPGALVGLALGAAPAARTWIAALGGGFLLHLALCHMVPAMLSVRGPSPWALLALQSAGLLGGWGLLLLLALNEQGDEH